MINIVYTYIFIYIYIFSSLDKMIYCYCFNGNKFIDEENLSNYKNDLCKLLESHVSYHIYILDYKQCIKVYHG